MLPRVTAFTVPPVILITVEEMCIRDSFYTTDAAVSPVLLEKALKTVVPGTYNQIDRKSVV